MLETYKQITKLSQTLNNFNLEVLTSESEQFCSETNRDLRIYLIGLKLSEYVDNQQEYLIEFFKYFLDIKNYTNIWSKFTIEMLSNKEFGIIQYAKGFDDVEKAIQDVINLLEQYNDSVPQKKAESAARSAARSAWSAARSAARSAELAESAARSAELAESAKSAKSAARSAELAELAELAAESATRLAAWSAMQKIAKCFIDILRERYNETN